MCRIIIIFLAFFVCLPQSLFAEGQPEVSCSVPERDSAVFSVFFRFDSSVIDTSYMENGTSIDSLVSILSDSRFKDSFTMKGVASPDGKSRYNSLLSRRRAEAVRNHVMSRLPGLDGGRIFVDGAGEDWDGLKALVLGDGNFPHKDRVLEIMDSGLSDDRKEAALRSIPGMFGYLIRHYLPYLRSATVSLARPRPVMDTVASICNPFPDKCLSDMGGGSTI